jgi:hypothetical protein
LKTRNRSSFKCCVQAAATAASPTRSRAKAWRRPPAPAGAAAASTSAWLLLAKCALPRSFLRRPLWLPPLWLLRLPRRRAAPPAWPLFSTGAAAAAAAAAVDGGRGRVEAQPPLHGHQPQTPAHASVAASAGTLGWFTLTKGPASTAFPLQRWHLPPALRHAASNAGADPVPSLRAADVPPARAATLKALADALAGCVVENKRAGGLFLLGGRLRFRLGAVAAFL